MRSYPRLRCLAWVLILAMLAPNLVMPRAAQAQRTPGVYVLDFNNETRVGGALLGRVAAAQMSLQLSASESNNWDVIPDAQVEKRRQDLGIQPPFDRVDRNRIATGIDADFVVYGAITDARVSGGNMPVAYVKVRVLVEDVRTGVLINGAIEEGSSTPRMGFTGDADILLEEALGKATFKAREFMDRFRLPEGTVLNTTVIGVGQEQDLDCLINVGARQGVRRGMLMIVTRQREVVGQVKVVSVDSDISTARVTSSAQGVRPEDRVRAIFNFSDFPRTRTGRRALAAPATGTQLASAPGKTGDKDSAVEIDVSEPRVAAATAKGQFIPLRAQGERNTQIAQGTVEPPAPVVVDEPSVETSGPEGSSRGKILNNTTVRMLAGGLLLLGLLAIGGRGGRNATRPDGVVAFAFQPGIGVQGARIQIGWDRPKAVRSSQVLQYVVWRTSSLGDPLQIVGAVDSDIRSLRYDNEATRTFQAFDGLPGDDDAGGRTTINAPGVVPGLQYRYQIATAYVNGLRDIDMDGDPTNDNDTEVMSPLSQSSDFVTAISPPVIIEPVNGTQVQLDELPITWQQTPGADTYVIWVSSSPNFPAERRVTFGPFRTFPVDQGGDPTVTQTIDARSAKLNRARTLFISVGARNSGDPRPRPFGAIFSSAVSVQPEFVPPDPPGTSGAIGAEKPGRGKGKNGDGKGGRRKD